MRRNLIMLFPKIKTQIKDISILARYKDETTPNLLSRIITITCLFTNKIRIIYVKLKTKKSFY